MGGSNYPIPDESQKDLETTQEEVKPVLEEVSNETEQTEEEKHTGPSNDEGAE